MNVCDLHPVDRMRPLHVVDRQRLHDLAGTLKNGDQSRWIAKHDVELLVGILLRRLTGTDDNLRAVLDRLRNIDLSQDVETISVAAFREITGSVSPARVALKSRQSPVAAASGRPTVDAVGAHGKASTSETTQ